MSRPTPQSLLAEAAELATRQARVLALLAEVLTAPDIQPAAPPPPDGDRLLTAEQVALALGLDVAAVARRRFPFARKLGRRTVRYSESGLRRFLRKGT